MPVHRIRYRRASTGGGGGNGGTPTVCPPTAVFADTFGVTDDLTVKWVLPFLDTFGMTEDALGVKVGLFDTFGTDDRLLTTLKPSVADTFAVTDNLGVKTSLPDTFGVADHFLGVKTTLSDTFAVTDDLIPTVVTDHPDTFAQADVFTKAQFRNVAFGATGTPDTDAGGDSWVDQASAATNHGTEGTLVAKGKSTLANDEQRALLEFDFTRYVNMTAYVGGSHSLTLRIQNPTALLSVDVTVQLSRLAARPFTESTVNWTNHPAAGTVIKSQVFAVPANSEAFYTMTLSDSEMNDLLGDWGYVRITTPTAAVPLPVNVRAREYGNTPDRPIWSFDLKR